MAEYEYKCKKCGNIFVMVLPKLSSPKIQCPECKSWDVGRKFSVGGIIFKGKGFYKTDSKEKETES